MNLKDDTFQFNEQYNEAPCGFVTCALDGTILQINKTLLDWTGIAEGKLTEGLKFQDLFSKVSKMYFQSHFYPIIREKYSIEDVNLELVNQKTDERLPVLINAKFSKNDSNIFRAALLNNAKRKQYEQELIQERKIAEELCVQLQETNAELEKFISVTSHDIKAPIANIISLNELIEIEYKQEINTELGTYLTYIQDSADEVLSLINSILENYRNSNASHAKSEEVYLPVYIEKIVRLIAYDKRVKFIIPETRQTVQTYTTSLTRIFINLISNAIKYNTNERPEIKIEYHTDSEFYYFSVHDNGEPISPAAAEKVFNQFENLEKKDIFGKSGTGIGLATVSTLVKQLGGNIQLHTNESGNCFNFTIAKLKTESS